MIFSLRRLDPHAPPDIELLKIGFQWNTEKVPEWYLDAEQLWGADSWDEALERARRPGQIEVGVFDESGTYGGLLTLELVGRQAFEFYIAAPRKSDSELTTQAAFAVCKQLLVDDELAETIVSWCCSRHRGAIALSKACGSLEDGFTMLRPTPAGRVLEWKRLILTRDRMRALIYGEEQKTDADERLRLHDPAGYAGHQRGEGLEADVQSGDRLHLRAGPAEAAQLLQ